MVTLQRHKHKSIYLLASTRVVVLQETRPGQKLKFTPTE